MQISNILIGMVVMAMVVSGVLIFVGDGVTKYSKTDFDNSSMIQVRDTYYEINSTVGEIKDEINTVTNPDGSIFDRVGAFFGAGYSGVKFMFQSFGSIFTVGDAAIGDSSYLLGGYGDLLKGMIMTIIIIIIIVAIVMHFLIKSDRL